MKECSVCGKCFPDDVDQCPNDSAALKFSLRGDLVLDERYRLEQRLGRGGMGIVFKASHVFLRTTHAVKVILPDLVSEDPMLVTRFRQEAVVAASIKHRNIVSVTDFGVADDTMPFLVMEFLMGRSLWDILCERRRLSLPEAVEVMEAIAAGVGAAHRRSVVHRDLKPLNVFVQDSMPISEGLKILDFGLAKIKSAELYSSLIQAQTHTTSVMGSPLYMAPEQWSEGEPDTRADIYSMGIILYQLLAGHTPFSGASLPKIMKGHLMTDPPSFASLGLQIPISVERVVRHALEKDPERRTASVEDLTAELREAIANVEIGPVTLMTALPVEELESATLLRLTDTGRTDNATSQAGVLATDEHELLATQSEIEEEAEQLMRELEDAQRRAEEARQRVAEAARKRAEKEAERKRAEEEAARKRQEEELALKHAAEEERKRLEAEQARKLAEAQEARRLAEEESKRKAEEERARRLAAEEANRLALEVAEAQLRAEEARKRADEEAQSRAKEEAARRSAEERAARLALEVEEIQKRAEEARQRAEEEARLRADEAPKRKFEEEANRLALEVAEAQLRAEEARKRAEEEAHSRAKEEAARRSAEERAARLTLEVEEIQKRAEEARQRAEEEAHLRADEAAKRKLEEEEALRLRQKQEARRLQEDEAVRLRAEADVARLAEEVLEAQQRVEQARLLAEAEAQKRIEEEAARRRAEEEALRLSQEVEEAKQRAEEVRRRAEEEARKQAARELERKLKDREAAEAARAAREAQELAISAGHGTIADSGSASVSSRTTTSGVSVVATQERGKRTTIALALSLVVLLGIAFGAYRVLFHNRAEPKPVITGMIDLPGGTFTLGRNDGPPQQAPAHAVTVGAFAIDRTEVTNSEYADFVRQSNHPAPAGWVDNKPPAGQEKFPVVNVSFEDAQAFAAWRSKRDGVYYRLPLEEEWEYAARADKNYLFPWGNDWVDNYANVKSDSLKPVGSYPRGASPWGVQDMVGNVMEWTSSRASAYPGGNVTVSVDKSDWLVVRGSSYKAREQSELTTTMRQWLSRSSKDPLVGFRLVHPGS